MVRHFCEMLEHCAVVGCGWREGWGAPLDPTLLLFRCGGLGFKRNDLMIPQKLIMVVI